MTVASPEQLQAYLSRIVAAVPGLHEMGAHWLAEACDEVLIYVEAMEQAKEQERAKLIKAREHIITLRDLISASGIKSDLDAAGVDAANKFLLAGAPGLRP